MPYDPPTFVNNESPVGGGEGPGLDADFLNGLTGAVADLFDQAPTYPSGAVATAVSRPSGIDARDYGAVGDGVADDTVALQAAITAAGQVRATGNTGQVVHLPDGKFLITGQLRMEKNSVVLRGAGRSATWIIAASSFPTGTPLIQIGPDTGTVFDTRLEELTIHCNGVAGSIGVLTTCAQEGCGLVGVRVRDYRESGWVAEEPASGAAPAMIIIDRCEFWGAVAGTNRGIVFDNCNSAEPIFLRHTTVLGYNTSTGDHLTAVYIDNSTVHIDGLYVEQYKDGVYAHNTAYVKIAGIHGVNGVGETDTTALVHTGPDSGTSIDLSAAYNFLGRVLYFESTGRSETISYIAHLTLNNRLKTGPSLPGWEFIAGRYSVPPCGQGNAPSGFNSLRVYPMQVQRSVTVDRIGIRVVTGQPATTVRLGIYKDDGTGRPGQLVLDAGTVDASATGDVTITISTTLTPGHYWVGGVSQGTGTAPTVQVNSSAMPGFTAASLSEAAQNLNAYEMTGVTGALPTTFTISGVSIAGHRVLLRTAP